MHVIQTAHNRTNRIARIEVVSHSTPQHDSKRDVLSLRIGDPFGAVSVDTP